MLFINHTSNSQAAKDYFKQELAQANYYMKDGQQTSGVWHGLAQRRLALMAKLTAKASSGYAIINTPRRATNSPRA